MRDGCHCRNRSWAAVCYAGDELGVGAHPNGIERADRVNEPDRYSTRGHVARGRTILVQWLCEIQGCFGGGERAQCVGVHPAFGLAARKIEEPRSDIVRIELTVINRERFDDAKSKLRFVGELARFDFAAVRENAWVVAVDRAEPLADTLGGPSRDWHSHRIADCHTHQRAEEPLLLYATSHDRQLQPELGPPSCS